MTYLDRPFPPGESYLGCLRSVSSPEFMFMINDLDDNETNSTDNTSTNQYKDLKQGGR